MDKKSSKELNPSLWVEKYGDYFYNYIFYRTNSEQVAEDIVQETFLAGIKSSKNYRGDSSEKTWLNTILRNKLMDYYRLKYKKNDVVSNQDVYDHYFSSEKGFMKNGSWKSNSMPNEWNNVESYVDNTDISKAINDCMSNLKDNALSVFKMKHLDDEKSEDICKELNISKSNYWVLMHRAKLQIRDCLDKSWGINKSF